VDTQPPQHGPPGRTPRHLPPSWSASSSASTRDLLHFVETTPNDFCPRKDLVSKWASPRWPTCYLPARLYLYAATAGTTQAIRELWVILRARLSFPVRFPRNRRRRIFWIRHAQVACAMTSSASARAILFRRWESSRRVALLFSCLPNPSQKLRKVVVELARLLARPQFSHAGGLRSLQIF